MKKLAAFLLFAFPAFAAPLALRSEVPVSEPTYAVAPEISRDDVHIATNGDQYFAVWTDYREGGEPSVYGARMLADGTVLDPLGIRIERNAYAGPLVWTGSKYLFVTEDRLSDGSVRTMTPDGVFGEPVAVGRQARYGSMATNGTNVLLVMPGETKLLDLEGHAIKNVTLAPIPDPYFQTRVAAAGSTYLVASATPTVMVQAVSSDGAVSAAQVLASPTTFTRIDVASDGERFLVVWPKGPLFGQFINTAGMPVGPALTIAALGETNYPTIQWHDGEYLAVFHDRWRYEIVAARIAQDGAPIGTLKRLDQTYSPDVAMAARGRDGIAMFAGAMTAAPFDDESVTTDQVFRRRIDVAVTARPQRNVRIARLGEGSVTAWVEGRSIYLSTNAGSIPVEVFNSKVDLIDVLVDRSNVIWVLWHEFSSNWIGLARFLPDLTRVDPGSILFETPGYVAPAAAAAGDGVIALAYQYGEPDAFTNVASLLLWETGTGIARKDLQLTGEAFADYAPTVAFDGSAFVYAWSHAKAAFPTGGGEEDLPEIELVGARVTPQGQLLDRNPVHIADDIGNVLQIDSAAGANGVAFAWQSYERTTRAALFNGTQLDLGGPYTSLAELAPHNGGFLLVRGTDRITPELTEVEYSVLAPNLAVTAIGTLPPYEAGSYWRPFDVDVIGGDIPVFAYAKMSRDRKDGNVLRVFVRKTGEAPPRRRALR